MLNFKYAKVLRHLDPASPAGRPSGEISFELMMNFQF